MGRNKSTVKMNSPMSKVVLLFASSLLICSSFLSTGVSAKSDLVDEVCQVKTYYSYDDCTSALSADPKSKTANDLAELGKIAMKIAITNTTITQDYIKKKAEGGGSVAYKNCVGLYDLSIGNFNVTLREIDEDPLTASYDVRLAGQSAVQCSSELNAAKFRDAVVAAGNGYIQLFSNIGAVITDKLS